MSSMFPWNVSPSSLNLSRPLTPSVTVPVAAPPLSMWNSPISFIVPVLVSLSIVLYWTESTNVTLLSASDIKLPSRFISPTTVSEEVLFADLSLIKILSLRDIMLLSPTNSVPELLAVISV